MALLDSMFLFEVLIKDLKSYTACKTLRVTGQFADIFKVHLNSPLVTPISKKLRKQKATQKCKIRCTQKLNASSKYKTYIGQSILIINNSSVLIPLMKKYPLEIFISEQHDHDHKLGSTIIPWNKVYINYLHKNEKLKVPPASTEGIYNVYDELTSKRIATIDMSLKLTHLRDKITSQFMSVSNNMPNTFMYTRINSKPVYVLSTVKDYNNQTDYCKTNKNESGVKLNVNKCKVRLLRKEVNRMIDDVNESDKPTYLVSPHFKMKNLRKTLYPRYVKSDTDIVSVREKDLSVCNSCSLFKYKQRNSLCRYIFGDPVGSFGNKVYHVGYFTVEKDESGQSSPKGNSNVQSSEKSSEGKKKFKFKKCDSDCLSKKETNTCSESVCSLDLPEEAAHLISVTKCKEVECEYKKHRELPSPLDDRILLDLTNLNRDCCAATEVKEKVEEVVGGVTAKIKIGQDPCFCTCECRFGFTKKTTYCSICGGYEIAGEELARKTAQQIPIPCPIFHKLIDKNKLKTWSTSGSDSKKRGDEQRSMKASSGQKAIAPDKRLTVIEKKSFESEKSKKKKKDDRFKFNYGYKAPQIGHSKCALPCSGTLDNVPKSMGWLWTAENVPGIKFRPMWKPGATNKHVVRLLKIARNPGEVISKKKRKETGKKKRPLKRPLLVVHKKDGEFTVTMETMKTYTKTRALNQHPYEDKPVITYTIGRTDEENRERLKKKERAHRRLERAQRHFIQSAFKDMCQDICLKTYQQALGILPDTEDPDCTCYPALPSNKTTNMDVSCSCSEDSASIGSDTDSDEWIVEFTPPNATFDPTYKGKKIFKIDSGSQYTYLDYRVKLVDRFGNPVPRFFKGPDGKQECSDLGGFWSPDHKWLELNVDGYVAPDGRWAPNNFIGPNGEQVDAETGKFQAMNGKWLVVGVDGFIDKEGKWKYYPKATDSMKKRRRGAIDGKKGKNGDKKIEKNAYKSEASWSCFGDISPKQLSKLGIVGHGEDRKLLLSTLQDMLAHGEDVKIPQPSKVFHLPPSKQARKERKRGAQMKYLNSSPLNYKCHHSVPSDKGIVAVDGHGNKTYFTLKDHQNKRPIERMATLAEQGISLSSFHVPCFHSFINSEVMKQQQRERAIALSCKSIATQVCRGWKPGAISKRLLRMLNKAKSLKSSVQTVTQTKRVKKQTDDKPTLIIYRNNGQYHVELQVTSENIDECNDQYTPLIYKIESANNNAKLEKRKKIQRRLVRAAAKEVWSDPSHPEACEPICGNIYKLTLGNLPAIERNCVLYDEQLEHSNSSCDDDETSSSCNSSEVDWEIHFTPPFESHLTTFNDNISKCK